MKLRTKLVISQILVFLIIFVILNLLISHMVYLAVSRTDRENAMNLNEQIMTRMDQEFAELKRFTDVVAYDEELKELIGEYLEHPCESKGAKIRLYLSSVGIHDQIRSYAVLGICIYLEEGEREQNFTTVGFSSGMTEQIERKVKGRDEKTAGFLNPFYYSRDSSTVFGNEFHMVYGYTKPYKAGNMCGNVTVLTSFDPIIYIAENMKDYSRDYLLLNQDGNPVPPSVSRSEIDMRETLAHISYGDTYYEGWHQEKDAVTTMRSSTYGNWKIVCRQTREEILENNRLLILLDVSLVAVFGVGVILLMIPLVRRFTRPLGEVSRQMREIARGNLKARVRIVSADEIAEVGKSFNIMAEKLQDNIDKIIIQEKREQKMRYSLLISQVDPHFIYNTMNTITYLAQKGKNKDVITVNKAMIEILKDRLRIEIEDVFDTVQQELNVVRQYLIIQSYRYEDTFKARFTVEDADRELYIAKNILQPLVENALFHGILCNKDEEGEIIGGCIDIRITRREKSLEICVKDNGSGMSEEQRQELEEPSGRYIRGEHIGIRNIKERILYLYGETCRFSIASKQGEGTTVILEVPVIEP